MSSNVLKFFPWDALSQFPLEMKKLKPGLFLFLCSDPYLQKIFLGQIEPSEKEKSAYQVLLGADISKSWLNENLNTFDLFQSRKASLVLEAEKVPSTSLEMLLDSGESLESHCLIMCFFKKSDVFKKLSKLKNIQVFEVEAPRFWEGKKLLNFLCDVTNVRLSFESQNYILEKLEHTSENFLWVLKNIALQFQGKSNLSEAELSSLLNPDKIDKFKLATLLGDGDDQSFYRELLPFGDDFELLRDLFAFLQGHFIKLADPSYLESKSRLNKYDQQIVAQSKVLAEDKIKNCIEMMEGFEILAKKKSPSLKGEIRQKYLETYL